MDNTREKYSFSNEDYARKVRSRSTYEDFLEITDRLNQITEELRQIKRILNMETDDGK